MPRELRRNALPRGRYSPLHSAGTYQMEVRRVHSRKDQRLRTFVRDCLAEGSTPEQISGWLKSGREENMRALGFEAIYAFIYRAAGKGEELWRYSNPTASAPPAALGEVFAGYMIKDRASIHDRHKEIEVRTDVGPSAGHLIILEHMRLVLVLHERKSSMTLATRLVGRTAAETISFHAGRL